MKGRKARRREVPQNLAIPNVARKHVAISVRPNPALTLAQAGALPALSTCCPCLSRQAVGLAPDSTVGG